MTCAFVSTVSGLMKNPVPRARPAVMAATAGTTWLTTSSSDASGALTVSGAAGTGCSTGVGASRANSVVSGICGLGAGSTAFVGRGAVATVAVGCSALATCPRICHAASPASTASTTMARSEERPAGASAASAGGTSTGIGGRSTCLKPHRHSAIQCGTRRSHDGQNQGRESTPLCYRSAAAAAVACSDLPAAAQVDPEQRSPCGMVLFVKRELRATVGGVRRMTDAGPRSTPQVDDAGGGLEQHRSTARADGRAQVHVLGVHEEPFVQQADGLDIPPPRQ